MRRLLSALLSLLLWCTVALAQLAPPLAPGLDDLNTAHPLARGLVAWYLVQPPTQAGPTWWNRLKLYPGILTNMGSGSGWQPTWRPGWSGEMRFDGSDDRVDMGDVVPWDFANQTFTVHVRWRGTNAANSILVTRRDAASQGGWFLRHTSAGAMQARLYGANSASVVAEKSSATTGLNNGNWQSATVVFTTDTATQANNTIVVYTNGLPDTGAGSPSGSDAYWSCSGCVMSLGAFGVGTSPLTGALDDIRIWSRGLTDAEVLAVHRCLPPDFCGLLDPPELRLAQDIPRTRRRVVIE